MKAKIKIISLTAIITIILVLGLESGFSWYMGRIYGTGFSISTDFTMSKGPIVHFNITNDQVKDLEIVVEQWKKPQSSTERARSILSTNYIMHGESLSITYPLRPKQK